MEKKKKLENEILKLEFSTTRRLTKHKPITVNNPNDMFESMVFLPESRYSKGQGGLRTKGYFKKSQPGKPLVTVITVVFNGKKYLEETIKSVLNQTYDNVEYIIIDGGSTDGTLRIIQKYENAIDYWVSEKDNGIYDAMNKGLKFSKGDFLFFLNAGDYFTEEEIIKDMVCLAQKSSSDLVYGDVLLNHHKPQRRHQKVRTKYQLIFRTICHQSILANRKCFQNKGFDTKFSWLADYKWVLQCFWNPNIKTNWINKPICFFDPENRTVLSNRALKCERIRERGEIGFSFFPSPIKYLFFANQLRLKAKFHCWQRFSHLFR